MLRTLCATFLFALSCAMSPGQANIARHIMKIIQPPQWTAITDSVLYNNIAFADQSISKIWIDSKRMLKTPKSFANVVTHELSHLRGAMHNDGQLGMQYVVTLTAAGEVVEDQFLLLTELANHPFLAKPFLPPVGVPIQNCSNSTF